MPRVRRPLEHHEPYSVFLIEVGLIALLSTATVSAWVPFTNEIELCDDAACPTVTVTYPFDTDCSTILVVNPCSLAKGKFAKTHPCCEMVCHRIFIS